MRYFVDTPMFGEKFMCARVSDNVVETRSFCNKEWSLFDLTLEELLEMASSGYLVEITEDPFNASSDKEYDC